MANAVTEAWLNTRGLEEREKVTHFQRLFVKLGNFSEDKKERQKSWYLHLVNTKRENTGLLKL